MSSIKSSSAHFIILLRTIYIKVTITSIYIRPISGTSHTGHLYDFPVMPGLVQLHIERIVGVQLQKEASRKSKPIG